MTTLQADRIAAVCEQLNLARLTVAWRREKRSCPKPTPSVLPPDRQEHARDQRPDRGVVVERVMFEAISSISARATLVGTALSKSSQ